MTIVRWYPILLFGAGFAIAWIVKPSFRDDVPEMPTELRLVARQRTPETRKGLAILESLRAKDEHSPDVHEHLEGLSDAEMAQLLGALSQSAGFHGLSDDDLDVLKEILDGWCDRDARAVVRWVLNLENDKDQEELFGHLFDRLVEEDLDRFFELADFVSSNHDKPFPISYKQMGKAAADGAETLIRLCGYSVSDYAGHTGFGVTYPEGFDFEKALDGLAQLNRSAPPGQKVTVEPSDLMETWATRDPESAWEWLEKGDSLRRAFQMREFLRGYHETADEDDFVDFLIENRNLIQPLQSGEEFQGFWHDIPLSLGVVEHFLDRFEGPEKERLAMEVLIAESDTFGGADLMIQEAALRRMSPVARYRFFMDQAGEDFRSGMETKPLRVILERLGHPEEELDEMLRNKDQIK